MPHKADASFFDEKRTWSKRKDLILGHYLVPYLAKVGSLGRPILVIDGFAGPGRFKVGGIGSPLIICEAVAKGLAAAHRVPIEVLCVEADPDLHAKLVENLGPFPFARSKNQLFIDTIDEVERLAQTHSVLMYLDPYAIQGIDWQALDRIFGFLPRGSSVEIILNFNAFALVRVARAACGLTVPPVDGDPVDATSTESTTSQRVDAVVGGPWWRDVIRSGGDSADEVEAIIEGVSERLGRRFAQVCRHDIKEDWRRSIPKYSLLFASRHADALLLMNDAAAKSRQLWEQETRPREQLLFETRPKEVVPDPADLDRVVLDTAADWISRRAIKERVARQHFGAWVDKDIRGCVERLLKHKRLESATGTSRITDETLVRRSPG